MRNVVMILMIGLLIIAGCKKESTLPTEEEIKKKREEIWKEIESSSLQKDSMETQTDTIQESLKTPVKEEQNTNSNINNAIEKTEETNKSTTTSSGTVSYKVQVFSATTEKHAQKIVDKINSELKISSAHIEKKRNFYRVIIGPFITKEEANRVKKECVKIGYKDAYILQSGKTVQTQTQTNKSTQPTTTQIIKDFFTIQIGSFSSLSNAEKYRKEANKKLNRETFIIKEGKLYKVFVGKYKTHKEAETNIKDVIKEYKDAFIIKK